jgi:hypothetical protein
MDTLCFLSGAGDALVSTRGHCGSRGLVTKQGRADVPRVRAAGAAGVGQRIGHTWVLSDTNHAQYGQLVLPETNKLKL